MASSPYTVRVRPLPPGLSTSAWREFCQHFGATAAWLSQRGGVGFASFDCAQAAQVGVRRMSGTQLERCRLIATVVAHARHHPPATRHAAALSDNSARRPAHTAIQEAQLASSGTGTSMPGIASHLGYAALCCCSWLRAYSACVLMLVAAMRSLPVSGTPSRLPFTMCILGQARRYLGT